MRMIYVLVFMIAGLIVQRTEICYSKSSESQQKAVNEIVQKYYNGGKFNGSVIVADDNGIIYEALLGYRDIDKKKELKENTRLGLASVSKIFTSTAVMKLVETGIIRMDESIRKYFPDLPEFYNRVFVF